MKKGDQIEIISIANGLDFPTSLEQVKVFLESYAAYELKSDPNQIDPLKILSDSKKKEPEAPTAKDFHKRTVLAAEIVYQLHGEWSMGRLKLQKLMYLAQQTTNMSLHTNFLKQANGPYDPVLMRSLEIQFKKHKWFVYKQGDREKYQFLENAGGHKEWYERYFANELEDILFLIELFRKAKTNQVELVATIYHCWKQLLDESNHYDFDLLVEKFYKWSEEKEKFSLTQIKNAISWMEDKGIFPLNK